MIKKYVKKPIIIKAIRWDGTNIDDVFDFVKEIDINIIESWDSNNLTIDIVTNEGIMTANLGDYIIKEPFDKTRGFYPCKPDIFLATYTDMDEIL
jgi:hypothetical protein